MSFEQHTIAQYHCPACVATAGPSRKRKRYGLWHRHNFDAEEEKDLPVQVGTPVFMEAFRNKEMAIPEA